MRDAAEVDGYFHLGAASTQEVTSFLSGLEKSDGPITRYKWRSSIDANGLLLEGVMVWTTKDGEEGSRLAFLMPDETGRWKIDYESLARMVKPTWLELLEGNADSATVRVFIAKDDYFNGPFKDETVWVCHGLASPDCGTVLMGYCKADSPQARALARILTDATRGPANPDPIRATLEIRRPQGAEKRQFEITRVMAEDWVISSKAFDDDFN